MKPRFFLVFCAAGLVPIALGYGARPAASLDAIFGIAVDTTNLTHIMRAVMGLYFGMIVLWLWGAFSTSMQRPALVACAAFMLGLAGGRILSRTPPVWARSSSRWSSNHAGHHRLAHRHGANADAGVVAALGDDLRLTRRSGAVSRGVRIEEVGFTANRTTISCPVEIPAKMPPAWLERKIGPPCPCGSRRRSPAGQRRRRDALADLHPLTALIDIIARPDRYRAWRRSARRGPRARPGTHLDHRADRVLALAHAVQIVGPAQAAAASGRKNGLRSISAQSQRSRSISMLAHLHQ
jgi:hypothetical protein